jgi:N-acetylmuramoyl-L-alanine amidase
MGAAARLGITTIFALGLGAGLYACHGRGSAEAAPAISVTEPIARAPIFPEGFGVKRIVLDAGHGAEDNRGNTSCFCVAEEDFTLAAADRVAERLEATGHFEIRATRKGNEKVAYGDRVDDAEAFAADAFVSIHSDIRGRALRWYPTPAESCPITFGATGFSVLYSDEGDDALTTRRLDLARAIATRLTAAGFTPYRSGYDRYAADPTAGVWVDRHALDQRIFVLRRPSMPSVILETHNALDPRDAEAWTRTETIDAAADALAAALVDALR